MEPEKQKRDLTLPASILIAALMVTIALVYNAGKKTENQAANLTGTVDTDTLDSKNIDLSNSALLGKSDAPITLIEYGDYQCPFCARFFEQTESAIRKDYVDTNKVKFAYKDMAFLGPESIAAAEAAACAQDQGKFWEYHDALFNTEIKEDETDDGAVNGSSERSGNLTRSLFLGLARNLKLDETDFTACLDSHKYRDRVNKETSEANAVMARPSTPSFFMNGKPLFQGALPYASFKQAIDSVLVK